MFFNNLSGTGNCGGRRGGCLKHTCDSTYDKGPYRAYNGWQLNHINGVRNRSYVK